MSRYVLDTTFVIDYLRDDGGAVARFARFFEDGDDPLITEIVVTEVATGSPQHPDPELTHLLEQMDFVQPPYEVALRAGQWRADARRNGRTLSLADSLIAAVADFSEATVLTRNVRDFAITPVRVETY
jgi:predicted nucleic acid-binding protein